MQWAGTGDGQPGSHQRFTLLGKKVCSGAICKLVGFSPQTWTRTHRKRSAEIHVDRLHRNMVRILNSLKTVKICVTSRKLVKSVSPKLERRYDTGGWCEADLVELEDKTLGQLLTDTVSQVVTV